MQDMKRMFIMAFAIVMVIILCACSKEKEEPTFDTSIYNEFIETLSSDPNCCGYQYTNSAATYIINQRGADVSISFESTTRPDMNMSASCVNGETIYVGQGAYFIDAAHKYQIPVYADSSVVDWIFDELKKYDTYSYSGNETVDGVLCDILSSSKKETINNSLDIDYDQYEVIIIWRDGQQHIMSYFDCSDKSYNVFSGDAPDEVIVGAWTVDFENNIVKNTETNESFPAEIKLVNQYKSSNEVKESVRTVKVFINRETQKVVKIQIESDDGIDEYVMLYPDTIKPVSIEGLKEMDSEAAEYVVNMTILMVSSL